MALATTLVGAATLPARLAVAFTRTTLERDRLSSPDGLTAPGGVLDKVLAPDGLADRMLTEDGFVEKLIAEGGTLEQLVELGDTLENIRPRPVQLAELIPALSAAVDALGHSVTPLGELAGRIPLSRRRQIGAPF